MTKSTEQDKPKKKNRTVPEQIADNRTRAQKNRAKSQEDLRNKFKGNQYIIQLARCMDKYTAIVDEISTIKMRKSKIGQAKRFSLKQQRELETIGIKLDCLKLQLDVVKAQVDLNFKRLKFVVPELRSMEFKDTEGKSPFEQLGNTLAAITQGIAVK